MYIKRKIVCDDAVVKRQELLVSYADLIFYTDSKSGLNSLQY